MMDMKYKMQINSDQNENESENIFLNQWEGSVDR